MTIRYKNQGFVQTNTNKATVLTCPTDATSQVNASPQGINLEAGDAVTVQAATGSNKIQGVISYAQIDRSQENG